MMTGRNVRGSVLVLLGAAFFGLQGATAEPTGDPGQETYGKFCASCHGSYGRGDGPLAKNVETEIPDFTVSTTFADQSDAELIAALDEAPRERHAPMMIALVLGEESLGEAIAYARTLSVPGGGVSLLAGRDIYTSSCWMCHGPEGNGKGRVLESTGAEARDFTSPEFAIDGPELIRQVSPGAEHAWHGSRFLPVWTNRLTPEQTRDLLEFLNTFKKSGP